MNIICPFCNEFSDKENNPINQNRIILETQNFVVLPTTGGFIENYQLIIPKKHINCFGELSESEVEEMKSIIDWQKKINKIYFNSNTSMFEHGALHPHNESGKSIVHAHMHIFPNDKSLLKQIEEYNFKVEEISDIIELSNICKEKESYIYYNDIDNKNYVISHEGIPSQFLRKLLAVNNSIENWNWREYPYLENIVKSIKFYEKNKACYKLIGGRIK